MLAGWIRLSHALFRSLKQSHHFGELILLPNFAFVYILSSGSSHDMFNQGVLLREETFLSQGTNFLVIFPRCFAWRANELIKIPTYIYKSSSM